MNELELLRGFEADTGLPSRDETRRARQRLDREIARAVSPRRSSRFGGRVLVAAAVTTGLVVAGVAVIDRMIDDRSARIATAPLAAGSLAEGPAIGRGPVTILMVGSDDRAGFDDAPDVTGERADIVVLARVTDHSVQAVWVPRDLAFGTSTERISAALLEGPDSLVELLTTNLEVEVNHYVELDMAGFAQLVDAVGGVEVNLSEAVRDEWSGLDAVAGCTRLDGEAALAMARSRTIEVLRDGQWVDVALVGDLSRIANQQVLVRSLARAVADAVADDPAFALEVVDELVDHLAVDPALRGRDIRALTGVLRRTLADTSVATLPVSAAPNGMTLVLEPSTDVSALLRGRPPAAPAGDAPPIPAPIVGDPGADGC